MLAGVAAMPDASPEMIRFLVERGVPVMAHVGLTPQMVNVKGGFRTTGRRPEEWPAILGGAEIGVVDRQRTAGIQPEQGRRQPA